MEKIETLENAIQNKNLVAIYSVFYTIVHGDPNFSTGKFEEVLDYVKRRKIDGLMQEFDGEEFEPEEKWDEEYWALIASSLMDNFCEVRIKHLKEVGKKIYPAKPHLVQKGKSDNYSEAPRGAENKKIKNKSGTKPVRPSISEDEMKKVRKKSHIENTGNLSKGLIQRVKDTIEKLLYNGSSRK